MITLLFTTSRSPISSVIRWFTRSKASHCMIGIYSPTGRKLILHCTAGGVQYSARDQWMKTNRLVAEYEFLPDVLDGIRHAESHLGAKYDYAGLISWGILILAWRLFRIRLKNFLASPTAMVCSEFVLHVNHRGNVPEWNDLELERTHCQDLIDRCEQGSSFVRLKSKTDL